jgi:putative spermidine/putrescine transport system ATP-binding protein
MQVELRQLQQRLGITTIVVTHDQREAMTMADLVVVMANGRVRQAASPIEIYRRPADTFVADFIGSTNLLPVETGTDGLAHVPGGTIPLLRLPVGANRSMLSIRPESVSLSDPEQASIIGRVTFVRDLGASVETYIEAGGARLIAVAPPRERHRFVAGDAVGVVLPPEACVVLRA